MSERTENFKKELASLCEKYDCEICLEDYGSSDYVPDIKMTVYFNTVYKSVLQEIIHPFEEICLEKDFDRDSA